MRTSPYKEKILQLFAKNHLLSISDIHKKISGADYSTIYRNVEQLVTHKDIKKVVFDKNTVMYEINNTNNAHDHFICIDCGLIDELERPTLTFKSLQNHNITDILIKGLCQNCN